MQLPSAQDVIIQLAFSGGFTFFLWLTLILSQPAFVAFRKRKSGFGIVFNSVTDEPEPLVAVRLRDVHGVTAASAVTDAEGRYRIVAPNGEYYVEVDKVGFSYPSKRVTKERNGSVYDNVLPSSHIVIKEHGAITKNIPIDPLRPTESSWLSWRPKLGKRTQYAIMVAGPALGIAIAIATNSILIWVVCAAYLAIIITRVLSFKPPQPPFGTIKDAESGKPLDRAMVRVFETRFNKLLETQITSPKGRYAFVVKKGSFRIWIKKQGYRSVILNFPAIRNDGALLTKDVKLKRI